MGIKILTDTGCDLPKELIKEYNIDILPLIVIKDDNEYLDRVDIQPKEVYEKMRQGVVYKTAQISPNRFYEKFEEYGKNKDAVIYLCFSSGLSGTYSTSIIVKEEVKEKYPELDLDIIDSKSATIGFGLIVLEAAKMAKNGEPKEKILEKINELISKIEHVFTVDDIEYLYRGGRVSRTQAVLGGLLNIKPILEVEDGKLIPIEKARGKNKAFKTMLDIIEKKVEDPNFKNQTIGIAHGDDLESALKFKEMMSEKFGVENFIIDDIGTAIGAHAGPGTLAVIFFRS